MKILSSHFAAICDKYDSPAPNGSFARRCEAARSSEKNSLIAKIFKYALTAALFLLATAFLIGAAAGYWIIVSRSDVPTSGICSYDSTNLLRYYLADESSDQFGKALNGDLGSASATYDGEFHFPIVSKTPIKKFDGYDKALLPLQFADFNYGGDLTQAYFDDFGYEYVLLTGFSAGAKISPENIKTSAEILKNQSNYTWIAGVPSDAGVYAVRITSLEEVTVVGSSATRSKYGSYIVIYTIAPATATITEAAPLGGSFIVENASSAQSAATMADDSIAGGDGTFIYGVDESGKPLNQGVKVTSLTLGGSSHSVSGYSDSSVGSVKNGLNIVLSDNVKSAANHSEADNENFWYTVTASLSGAEAGNYALSNATSLRFRIAPVELNADDIKWYYDGAEATNGKTVVYDGSEHGLTALIDETTVSNRYYAKYGNDESVKSAVKSLIDAINGGSAPLTLGVYTRSNDNYTAAIPSTAKVAKNAGIYLFSADVYLGGKRSTDVYLATEATNTLTINAAKLTVNYDPDPVYNGKAQQPTFTLAGLIGNDGMGVNAKVTKGATVVEPINCDSYTLTLSVSGETYLNYVFGEPTLTTETSTSHIYEIIPKPVSLTTSNVSDITYDGVVHAPTATYIDVSGATVDAVTAITKDGTDINANDVKNAGAYTLTASLKDKANYVWADNNTTADKTYNWTISKANITITPTVTSKTFTYGTEIPESTISYNIEGTNYNNELTISLVLKDSGSGKICELPSVLDAGTYNVSVTVKGDNIDNYNVKSNEDNFEVTPLEVKFSGIININYTDTDKTLNATLLKKGLVKSSDSSSIENLSMPSFSSAVARTYDSSTDDNNAYTETKDAQGNITSISGEHGYYKVTLNSAFTVGSTYKVTAVLNSDNYAFAVGGNTIIVKYKTAKIGNAYYTIEDALSESASGNITLAGNSSGSASYIITSFTMLSNTMLSNYNDSKSYTLSGRKLIVPYNANGDERNTFTDSGSFGNVYSALIIPNGVSLNLEKKETNNATLTVAAYVGFNQNISTTLAKEHGVLMNNGNLIVQSGCTINAHGYIKGTGLIELKNGATAVDTLSIYDWPGGTAASEFYKDAFPTNAYTIHNISCKTKIYGGAMYKAKVFVYLKKGIEIKLDEEITVIGNSDKHGMFYTNSTDEDTYVLKSVKAVNDINSNIGSRNQESGASAKNNRDLIAVFGNYFDDSVNISKTFLSITISLKTSTSVPLPIGYMDVTVSKGTLSLSASDYMILPGATIKVEKGANLVVGNKVDITAVPYDTVSAYGGDRNYTAFSTWNKTKINGRLIINGTLTCVSGANIGGLVECETDGATVILKNTTATYKTMYSTNKPYYASGTLSAIGNTVDGENQNLENTTYKSQEVGSNIVWVKANNIKTITFDSCGGTLISSKTIILTNGNFTIPATNEDGSAYLETPSLDYYTFVGWFTANGNQISVGSIVSDHITLYAHWTPNTYQIVYEWTHSENSEYDFSSADIVCPLDEYKAGETLTLAAPTTTATDLSFVAWYDKDGNQISNITLSNIANLLGDDGKLHILGNWTNKRVVTYTISIIVGNKDLYNSDFTVDCENEITATEGDYKDFTPIVIDSKGKPLDPSYGTAVTNYNYAKYFVGWYTDESFTSPYTNKINGDTTLYAKWENKIETTIEFKDTNNSELLSSITKFFMPGFNINKELLDSIHNELGFLESINAGKDHKEYYFDKWFVGNEELKSQAISLTENVVIKAQYKRCYHIIISGDDGITPKNETIYVDPSETMYSLTINGSSDNNNGSRYRIIEYSIEINGSTQTTTINNETTTIDININLPSDSSKDITVSLTTRIQYQITINNGSYTPMTVKLGGASGEDIKSGNYYDGGVKIYVKSNGKYGIVDTAHNNAKIVDSPNASATVELKNTLALQATTDSCIAAGTLITLWDGSKKKVEDLTNADVLLVFNHETGAYDYAKLLINEHQGQSYDYYSVMNLYFSAGSVLKIIKEHGFFDLDLNRYVYINENNYSNYIGHKFFQTDWNGSEFVGREVTLDNVAIKTEYTAIFSPVTEKHFNIFTENILSVSTELDGLLNIFEYGENMQYDEEKMKADIEKYGLFTYEDWKDYVSKDIYDLIPFKYYKVAIGKGYITMEHMHELIEKYFYKFYAAQNDNNNDEQISCQTSG